MNDAPSFSLEPYYQDDYVTIYHGDCGKIMPHLGEFDLLLTDPPYGITADRDRNSQDAGWVDYGEASWDTEPVKTWLLDLALSKADKSIIWGGNYFLLPPSMGWPVWDKGQRDFSLADCELAWTNQHKAIRAFTYSRSKAKAEGNRSHPTQKPLALMAWSLQQMRDVETCLDPWMGTGTTLRACKDMGVKCVGIEIQEKHCETAARRMAQEVLPFNTQQTQAQHTQQEMFT